MPKIPDPELVSEAIDGALYTLPGGILLVVGKSPALLAEKPIIFSGAMIARFAIPMYSPAQEAVIPGLLVGERGGFIVGREAWDFIEERFQLFPRADVIGQKVDGSNAQVFLRELDLARPVRVLVYDSKKPTSPLAEPTGLFLGAEGSPPELLAKHLPHITDLSAWLKPK